MTETDLVLTTIELLKAINQNDLENTKILVDYLNNNFEPMEGFMSLDEVIPLNDMLNNNNESFLYVINNLQNYPNIDRIQWYITVKMLQSNNDNNKIEQFIIDSINSNNVEDYQVINLINLCTRTQRYDLLDNLAIIVKNF